MLTQYQDPENQITMSNTINKYILILPDTAEATVSQKVASITLNVHRHDAFKHIKSVRKKRTYRKNNYLHTPDQRKSTDHRTTYRNRQQRTNQKSQTTTDL